ncbi:MAG: hypothetical protein ABSA46_12255 [Thermodesulfovibrionales bacterium]|jgi:hypothetical protein
MKKTICLVFVVVALLLSSVVPAHAHYGYWGGGHFSVWVGPGWGPWWWGAPGYPYYPYYPSYYGAPPVVQEQTPVYVEPTPQQPEEQYYWYFCPDSKNYYPYVKSCPSGWLKVVPPEAPQDRRE